MKRIISLLVITILFIPMVVNAAECDTSQVYIDSMGIENQSGNVLELKDTNAKDKKINLNLRMSTKDDEILYKVVLKNDSNEDYEINKNNINLSSDYIDYTLESDDNNIIKANSTKTVYLRVKYKTEVDPSSFENGEYVDKITMKVNLKTDDTPTNPNTGISYIIILSVILIISGISLIIYKKKKLSALMIIIGLIILPIGVKALCSCDLVVDSNVIIKKEDSFKIRFEYNCSGSNSYDASIKYKIGMSFNEFLESDYFSSLDQNTQTEFSHFNHVDYRYNFVEKELDNCLNSVPTPNPDDYATGEEYNQAYNNANEERILCYQKYTKDFLLTDKIKSKDEGTYVIYSLCPIG